MLVLARSTGQRIQIGEGIVITIVRFHPHKNEVSLGIEAPLDLPGYPAELTDEQRVIWQQAANDA